MERHVPCKRQMGSYGQITYNFWPADHGELATEQFLEEVEYPGNFAMEKVDEVCNKNGWHCRYQVYAAGIDTGDDRTRWCSRLVLSSPGRTVRVFYHNRPENNQVKARARVAERAVRWVEIRSIAHTIEEPFLNLCMLPVHRNENQIIPNPKFDAANVSLFAFVHTTFGNSDPLYDKIIKDPKLLKIHAKKIDKYVESFETYKAQLDGAKAKPTQPIDIAVILQSLQANPLTAKFEHVAEPIANIKLENRDHATQVGEQLAVAIFKRFESGITAKTAASALGHIVGGMQEVLERVDRLTTPGFKPLIVAPIPILVPPVVLLNHVDAIAPVGERLKDLSMEGHTDLEAFFRTFGAHLMLRLEKYDRSVALAFEEGFEFASGLWVEDLIDKERQKSGLELEQAILGVRGPALDVCSEASAQQMDERGAKKFPKAAALTPKTRKRTVEPKPLAQEDLASSNPTPKKPGPEDIARPDPMSSIAYLDNGDSQMSKAPAPSSEPTTGEPSYHEPTTTRTTLKRPATEMQQFDDVALQQKYFPSDNLRNRCLSCALRDHGSASCPSLKCTHCGIMGDHATSMCPTFPHPPYHHKGATWLSSEFTR